MGDVLAGLMGSMIAQGKHYKIDAFNACLLSVQLHAKAADQLVEAGFGPIGLTASELANQIRKLINDFI
jgi:NAD(P)H-hydrate repair Nnr-like enzyme with NAD(P)H-hydrate dehydratase domain